MFFKALHEVAKHTALSMIITPQGGRLRVIIMPKPGKDAKEASALSKPIEATGTPEELDAELPKAIASYAEKVNELRAAIKVPIEALNAAKAKAAKQPRAAKKPKPPAKPKAAKPAKKAAKPKPPAAPRAAKSSTKKTPTPRASLPGKDQCLEDLRAYMTTGKDLNRAAFIAWARKNGNKTGRRFEKLWSGWHEFQAAGKPSTSGAPRADAPPSSNRAKAPSPASASSAVAPEPSVAVSKTAVNPANKWPFPNTAPTGTHVETLKKPVGKPRSVQTETGKLLGAVIAELTLGDKYTHSQLGDFRVIKVEAEKYIVQPFPDVQTNYTRPPAAEESKQP